MAQATDCLEQRVPVDIAVAWRPVAIVVAIGVLQVKVAEQIASLTHPVIGRWTASPVGDESVANVNTQPHVR